MTVIVACENYVGSDSLVSVGDDILTLPVGQKFVIRPKFALGFAGDLRVRGLIERNITVDPALAAGQGLFLQILDQLEEILVLTSSFVRHEKGDPLTHEFDCVCVLSNGQKFIIGHDFSWHELSEEIVAIGSGSAYALGNLEATGKLGPKARIKKAVESAKKYSSSCGGETFIEKVD